MQPSTYIPDVKTSAATALAAFVFLAALAAVSVSLVQPPRAVPETAPPAEFSSARADAPLRIAVEDLSYGLPEIPGQNFRVRAEDTMPVPSYRTSDTTVVRKTLSIEPQKP